MANRRSKSLAVNTFEKEVTKVTRKELDSDWAQKYFCAQPQARILNGFGTGRLRVESQGLLFSFLTFLRPIFFLARLDFFPPPLTAPGSPRMHVFPRTRSKDPSRHALRSRSADVSRAFATLLTERE